MHVDVVARVVEDVHADRHAFLLRQPGAGRGDGLRRGEIDRAGVQRGNCRVARNDEFGGVVLGTGHARHGQRGRNGNRRLEPDAGLQVLHDDSPVE